MFTPSDSRKEGSSEKKISKKNPVFKIAKEQPKDNTKKPSQLETQKTFSINSKKYNYEYTYNIGTTDSTLKPNHK